MVVTQRLRVVVSWVMRHLVYFKNSRSDVDWIIRIVQQWDRWARSLGSKS